MIRRFSFTIAAAVLAGVVLSAANATIVTRSGERHSGQLTYNQDDTVELVSSGQTRSFPWDDIVLVAFSGDPTREEIEKLPTSANPPELERHLLVYRNGDTVRGKLHDFRGENVSFDVGTGSGVDRRTIPMSDVQRIYLNAQSARSLFSNASPGQNASTPSGGGSAIRVEANRAWTDTGILVRRGEQVTFKTNGQIQIAPSTTVGPDGDPNSPGRRTYAVRTMNSGGLVGRAGNVTFPIGSTSSAIQMPAAGRLMLGINDDNFRDNSGAFEVTVTR